MKKDKKINLGDIKEFNNEHNKLVSVKVVKLHHFRSFYELYNKFDKMSVGYNKDDIANPKEMS